MKRVAKRLKVTAAAVIISFLGLTTVVENAHGQRVGRCGGFSSGYRGEYSARFTSGLCGGFSGGYRGYYGGSGVCGYGYSAQSCYDTYYYPGPAVAPAYYSPPPAVYVSPQPVVYNLSPPTRAAESSLPTVIRGTQIASSLPEAQSPSPTQSSSQNQSLGVAEVKALAKAGLSEELIINQIRNSGVVYHLAAAEIIDLRQNGVSEKVINAMISTPPAGSTANDARFKLTGIVSVMEGGFGAVINGQTVVENGYVDGATVKKIDRNQVALDLNGHEVVVRLF